MKIKAKVMVPRIETKELAAKKGDVVEIPADEKEQSPAIKHSLSTGKLVVIDLKPVTSKEVPPATGGDTDTAKEKEVKKKSKK